jgi:hypothetical protein
MQATNWGEIDAKHKSQQEEWVPRIQKELLQLSDEMLTAANL